MFHNPWVNKSVSRSLDLQTLSKYYKYIGIHGSF